MDPISGTAIAGIALSAIGTGYGVYAARQQASFAADIEEENARASEVAARDALARGSIEEQEARRRTRLRIGAHLRGES